MAAFIDGHKVGLTAAVAEAARMLASARLPVVAGLGTDIAGARAALMLAARVGAAVDHMHAGALLRDLDVMREAGMMVTTPSEARLRADLYLLVGRSLAEAPDMRARLLDNPPLRGGAADEAIQESGEEVGLLRSATTPVADDGLAPSFPPPQGGREHAKAAANRASHFAGRRIVWLCPPPKNDWLRRLPNLTAIGRVAAELPTLLALLRARTHGHHVAISGRALAAVDAVVATLKAARFGVAVWSAADLDALSIEMLCSLVDDLNAETRFTGLPLPPPDNGRGVLETCGWKTGFPMRTGFGRGRPEHDPWRFDAARLVDSGECDCAVWISACRPAAPDWRRAVPTVALTTPGIFLPLAPHVLIEVGVPGIDHDAVTANPLSGTLMPTFATWTSDALPVAAVITDLLAALPEAPPC